MTSIIKLTEMLLDSHPLLSQAFSPWRSGSLFYQTHYRSTLDFLAAKALVAAEKRTEKVVEEAYDTLKKLPVTSYRLPVASDGLRESDQRWSGPITGNRNGQQPAIEWRSWFSNQSCSSVSWMNLWMMILIPLRFGQLIVSK